ncbi:hypothetical protein [Prauserella aidingensis]|nr:hypothetical protein [Prauserella aidingensis]
MAGPGHGFDAEGSGLGHPVDESGGAVVVTAGPETVAVTLADL